MGEPLVSVVMPTYHSDKFLGKAIRSILGQTYKNLELIIVSDDITEREYGIIASYYRSDNRIAPIENKIPLGLVESLNLGFSVARGKYIARMDADDISYPDRIEKQVQFMEAHPDIGILGTSVMLVGSGIKRYLEAPKDTAGIIAMMMFYGCAIFHPTVMIRKEFIRTVHGPYKGWFSYAEDYYLWIRCIGKTEMANLKEPLLEYHRTESSIGIVHNEKQRDDIGKLMAFAAEVAGFPQRRSYQTTENYFIEMDNFNDAHHILNRESFKRYIGEAWYNYCLLQAYKGWSSWNMFWGSPLSEYIQLSLSRRIKFAAVCLLRKKL